MGKLCSSAPVNRGGGQRILFTGPDGIGNYRAKLIDFPHSIGIGPLSPEATGDLNYLFRAAPAAQAPRPKHCYIAEVGWGTEYSFTLNARTLFSNNQIKLAEFRSALENRFTHRYQNPWQPTETQGRPALVDNTYRLNDQKSLLSKRHMAQKGKAEGTSKKNLILPPISGVRSL